MEAVIGCRGGLQPPSHWRRPNITIGGVVWKAAHDLIKTTVDCVCGNELEHQSHHSVGKENRGRLSLSDTLKLPLQFKVSTLFLGLNVDWVSLGAFPVSLKLKLWVEM